MAYWDGQKVCINKDPWLPFTNIKSFSSVSVLINENTHTWNVEAVHALFSDWEAAAICSIPLPQDRELIGYSGLKLLRVCSL